MITDENIRIEDIKPLLSAGLDYNRYYEIRQQVLKEVNDALRSIDITEFTVDKHIGVAHCQNVVRDMMEGRE